MNSKKVASKSAVTTSGVGTSSGSVNGYPKSEQISSDMGYLSMGPSDDGQWEVISKKKNKTGSVSGKQWNSNPAPKTWVQSGPGRGASGGVGRSPNNCAYSSDSRKSVGRGNPKQQLVNRNWESAYMPSHPSGVPPPLQHGWKWGAKGGSTVYSQKNDGISDSSASDPADNQPENLSDDDGDSLVNDSDEDYSDDYDSDASQKSHETRKKNKWFKGLFEDLDKLAVEEIGEQTRQWHCPACHKGPGAIEWYNGLQPLITHAKTKRSNRARLHRELAVLLDEELRRRGSSAIAAGEAFGKWKGLLESTTDREIVWPSMVVIMNTLLEKDENDKWIGMGNQELLDYFNTYSAKKARHSYGPYGHRGLSVLIFESSAMGYMEAERLHKHFMEQGTDRKAWERGNPVLFHHGGKRQLYGFLAQKEDLDAFNQHSQGKSRLKFEMKSYQEMVVIPIKQMSEDNQLLTYLKNKVVKEKEISKALKDTVVAVSQKLRETKEENRIVRLRTKKQQEESQEMMNYLESFYKDQIENIHKHTEEKEKEYEELLQEERAKAELADSNQGNSVNKKTRKKNIESFLECQGKDVEAFESRRDELIRTHEKKKIALRERHLAEEVELEKEFDAELTQLMEEYAPSSFQNGTDA